MSIKHKAITIAMIGVAVSSLVTAPVLATAVELPPQETKVYVLEEEGQRGATVLRERGRCTDSYSKAWCDSHGFKNNRPVPHKVQLTKKEADCYWGLVKDGIGWVLSAVTKDSRGVLSATANVAYTLHKCLK